MSAEKAARKTKPGFGRSRYDRRRRGTSALPSNSRGTRGGDGWMLLGDAYANRLHLVERAMALPRRSGGEHLHLPIMPATGGAPRCAILAQ